MVAVDMQTTLAKILLDEKGRFRSVQCVNRRSGDPT